MKARFECNGRFLSLGEWQLSNPWPNKSANSSFSNCFRGNSKGLLKGFVVLFVSYKTDIWSVILHKHLLSITWGSIILIFGFFRYFWQKCAHPTTKCFLNATTNGSPVWSTIDQSDDRKYKCLSSLDHRMWACQPSTPIPFQSIKI